MHEDNIIYGSRDYIEKKKNPLNYSNNNLTLTKDLNQNFTSEIIKEKKEKKDKYDIQLEEIKEKEELNEENKMKIEEPPKEIPPKEPFPTIRTDQAMGKETMNQDTDSNKKVKASYSFPFNICTKCCKNHSTKENDDLQNSLKFVNYYMDVHIYLKKMLELEIIKFCFFSKNEREVINLLVNPDENIESRDILKTKLDTEYNCRQSNNTNIDDIIKEKMHANMQRLVEDGKERKVSKRLLKLVSNEKLKF